MYEKGFTLIEVMIVIVIVGILSSVAVPQYINYIGKVQTVEGFKATSSLRDEIALWVWEYNSFPNDLAVSSTGVIGAQARKLDGKYIKENSVKIAANTGIITIDFDAGNIAGKTLVLTPEQNNINTKQIVGWKCSGTIEEDKLPSTCR